MIEMCADIWELYDAGKVVCITTNGHRKKNGEAVMGRGTARQAVRRWPKLTKALGELIRRKGNVVQLVHPRLLAFPVKGIDGISDGTNVVAHKRRQFPSGSAVPGWALKVDLDIIRRSLAELAESREEYGWKQIYLPRPGCGAGELD